MEDTECIVAKAIRDGGIDAVLDHEQGYMQSKASHDVYSTDEPQTAYHARIAFCLDIHNEVCENGCGCGWGGVRGERVERGVHACVFMCVYSCM